ncbi:ATP-binding protein [Mesorhizobium sp. M1006]|uniref:AAA family ATPase n=1 Tax=Mesorhizobium sp. M1006 TaxID=2957048 RepID=UPI00333DDF9A
MTTLHLICGLPDSGKTTLARKLEEEGEGTRLSPDEWMLALGFDLYDETSRARVEQLQWTLAQRLLASGTSVVLKNGFWTRQERDDYRSVAVAIDATTRIHYLAVPIEELKHRIIVQNRAMPAGASVDPNNLVAWSKLFEPPTQSELNAYAGRVGTGITVPVNRRTKLGLTQIR